tara:strand:- start:526 stop:645 length:120 start_codon:yes stop_codon:yes gene_type:complete
VPVLRDARLESSCCERLIDLEAFNGIVDVELGEEEVFMG